MTYPDLKPIATKAQNLPVSGIRKFFDIVASMQDVISLGVGEPDFITPWTIREAAIYSLERGQTTYTSNYGLLELRKEISRLLDNRYGVKYKPEDQILVTVGVSEGLDLAMRTLLEEGDEVLVAEPCYVSYKPCIILAGGVPVGVETRAENHFKVLVEDLEQKVTAKTKGILLGYPSNPTGATMSHSDMADIVNFARKHGLYILSDEIYDRLSYDSPHVCVPSVAGAYERTILFNGFSKAYAMTGWRIGFVCAPENIIAAMTKLHSYTMLCAPITGQKAALEALKSAESEVVEMVRQYNQRRHLIVDGLNAIGLKCHMPEGAFYAFPSIKNTGLTSEQFAERLLFEEKVALVPGTAFGASGEGHVRCSYATATDKIEMALMRMKRFVDKLAVKV
jgi:aminotransferase